MKLTRDIPMLHKGGLFRPTTEAQSKEPAPSDDELLLTDAEVMALLKVSKQWLRDHTTRVEPIVPHVRIGRSIRYPKRALNKWIADQVETRPRWERQSDKA